MFMWKSDQDINNNILQKHTSTHANIMVVFSPVNIRWWFITKHNCPPLIMDLVLVESRIQNTTLKTPPFQ